MCLSPHFSSVAFALLTKLSQVQILQLENQTPKTYSVNMPFEKMSRHHKKQKKASNDQLTFMRIKNVESKNQMVSL